MASRVSDILLLNGQGTIADFRLLIDDTRQRAISEGRQGKVEFGINAFIILRDTEEEAEEVLREIIRLSDKAAIASFKEEVKQAGASSKEGQGMWAKSDSKDLVRSPFTLSFRIFHSHGRIPGPVSVPLTSLGQLADVLSL